MPYSSPSSYSYSGGRARAVPAQSKPAFDAWREATKRAAAELQQQKKGDVVAGRPYKTRKDPKTGQKRFVVKRAELDALTEKYFRQAGFERRPRRSPRVSRKPVSEDEAVDMFLEGYARQASQGHHTNPSGKRRYPSRGAIANRIKPELRGQPFPDRVKHDFKNAGTALRSRVARAVGKSPDAKGRVNGRRVVRACSSDVVDAKGHVKVPKGMTRRKVLEAAGCADSWKLRRRNAWKNYQVPGVTHFDSPKSARSSPLYKKAKALPADPSRKTRDGSHLAAYRSFPRHRKNQSPGDYNARVGHWDRQHPNVKRSGRSSSPSSSSPASRGQSPSASSFDDLFD